MRDSGADGRGCARAVDEGACGKAAREDVDELPHDLALDGLPQHEAGVVLVAGDEEGEDARDDEDVGGLEAGEVGRVELAREGQGGGDAEEHQADRLLALHLGELGVLLGEELLGAAQRGLVLDAPEHEDGGDGEHEGREGQEADHPVDVHVLRAGELLDVVDGDEVHSSAKGRGHAAHAGAVGDVEQQLGAHLGVGDVALAHELEHGDGDGRDGGADHGVGQDGRQRGREQHPEDELLAEGAAHQAQELGGDAPVEPGFLPRHREDGGAQQQQDGLGGVVGDDRGHVRHLHDGVERDG